MRLLIADKKAIAERIATTLGEFKKFPHYFKSDDFYFCWTSGFIVTNSAESHHTFKSWTLNALPIYPKNWTLDIVESKKDLFETILKIASDDSVNELLCATEPSREGQLIFDLLYRKMDIKKSVKRLWCKDLTENEIKSGLVNSLDNHYFLGFFYSALARNKSDYIYGTNMTRLLSLLYSSSLKVDDVLRVGRVQTPALVSLVEREKEIKAFTPLNYFEFKANCDGFSIQWYNKNGFHIDSHEDVSRIRAECMEHKAVVTDIITKKHSISPPLPYNLGDLQKDALIKHQISPDECLVAANSLYEKGLISYPKTESRKLPTSIKPKLKGMLKKASKALPDISSSVSRLFEFGIYEDRLYETFSGLDHGAIMFTSEIEKIKKISLAWVEMRVLLLIVSRVIISLSGDFHYSEVKSLFKVGSHYFRHIGGWIHDLGWKDFHNVLFMFEPFVDENQKHLRFIEGEVYTINSFDTFQRSTHAPNPFHITDLIDMMYINNIGSVSNRGSISKDLASNNYITIQKNIIFVTDRGRRLYDILSEDIKSNRLCIDWDHDLDQLLSKRMTDEMFIDKVKSNVDVIISHYNKLELWKQALNKRLKTNDFSSEKLVCPLCGSMVLENSKKFYCSTWKPNNSSCQFEFWKKDFRLSSHGFVLSNDEIITLIATKSINKYSSSGSYTIKLVTQKKDRGMTAAFSIEEL